MKSSVALAPGFALLLLCTGCFQIGSETRALRDAALENGLRNAEKKFELGVGMLTVGAARAASLIAAKYAEIPAEAQTILSSVNGADVSIYKVKQRGASLPNILKAADQAMQSEDCYRLAGVIRENQLVAVYVPRKMDSARNIRANVLVLNGNQLVCASARGNAEEIIALAMSQAREQLPERGTLAVSR